MRFAVLLRIGVVAVYLWGASCYAGSPLQVPGFVTSVPKSHFAGVSTPCKALSEARKSAVNDVVRQVLGTIGIEYDYKFFDLVSGDPRNPKRVIDDRLYGVAHGVVLGVGQSIVKSSWWQDATGRYVYFILVRYPDKKIREMRRLSKGAKILASVISENQKNVKLRVTEVNGVSVVLSSLDITVRKRNRYAKAISFYIWHVPSGSQSRMSIAIDPVRVCGGTSEVKLPLDGMDKDFIDYLLGADLKRVAVLKGHDELGRPISAKVVF